MKKVLVATLSLLFATHGWADDTAESQDGTPATDVIVRADCSLGLGRQTLPEEAADAAVSGVIVFLCSPNGSCVPDVTVRGGLLVEVTDGPVVSTVQREGWRAVELGRKDRMRVPLRPAGGRRWSGVSVWR